MSNGQTLKRTQSGKAFALLFSFLSIKWETVGVNISFECGTITRFTDPCQEISIVAVKIDKHEYKDEGMTVSRKALCIKNDRRLFISRLSWKIELSVFYHELNHLDVTNQPRVNSAIPFIRTLRINSSVTPEQQIGSASTQRFRRHNRLFTKK